jgi:hypothetical protein
MLLRLLLFLVLPLLLLTLMLPQVPHGAACELNLSLLTPEKSWAVVTGAA